MSYLIGFLSLILFFNCLFLILLILVQLPKKEAGMGSAFGGGGADALFGAGQGNTLTMLTKWGTVAFLGLALVLSVMNANLNKEGSGVRDKLNADSGTPAPVTLPTAITPAPSNAMPNITNIMQGFGSATTNAAFTNAITNTTVITNALNAASNAAALKSQGSNTLSNALSSIKVSADNVANAASKATNSVKATNAPAPPAKK